MEFKEIVLKRYACKKFNDKKISEEKINELLEIIRMAPSSLNVQPWKIKVISDLETKKKLFRETKNQIQTITCSHMLVFCVNTYFEKQIEKLGKLMIKKGVTEEKVEKYTARVLSSISTKTTEEKFAWAEKQVYLTLGNALNGAFSLGFDSCPMAGFRPKGYSKVLNLPSNLVPVVLCALGYADDVPKKKIRFSKEEIFF